MNKRALIMLLLAGTLSGGYGWRATYLDSAPVPAQVPPSLAGERHQTVAADRGAEIGTPEQGSSMSISEMASGGGLESQRPIDPPVPASFEAEIQALEAAAQRSAAEVTPLSAEHVQAVMLDAIRAGDMIVLNGAKNELIKRAKEGNATAIQAISSAIDQVPANQKTYFIGILGEIATPDALGSLIDILEGSAVHRNEAWYAALDAIGSIGRYRSQNVSPEQLAALIEDYIERKPPDDPHLVAALGRGLSTLGTRQGVGRFLRVMDEQEASKAMTSSWAGMMTSALSELRNPEAVTLLQARLQEDPGLERATTRVAGAALAAMGNVRASEALLWWASELTGGKPNEQALTWLSQVRDEKSLQLLLHTENRFRFRDPALLAGITALAKQIDEQSTPRLVQ